RMMHQRNQGVARAHRLRGVRQRAKGEAVDHERTAMGQRRYSRAGARARLGRRAGKTIAKVDDLRAPAERRKLRDDPPIVGVAAGGSAEVARYREEDLLYHSGASYQARAVGDSATVTRIDASSRPSRPSLPARAAAAKCSNRCRVKNSVVVLMPLNCGSSSRLR